MSVKWLLMSVSCESLKLRGNLIDVSFFRSRYACCTQHFQLLANDSAIVGSAQLVMRVNDHVDVMRR